MAPKKKAQSVVASDSEAEEPTPADGKNPDDPLAEKPLAANKPIQIPLGGGPDIPLAGGNLGGVNPLAVPPPLPSPPKQEIISSAPLMDINPSYLYDRSTWPDFKKALTECGGSWNLPDWMHTIVRGGSEWKRMLVAGVALEKYFPTTQKKSAGDGLFSKNSSLGSTLVTAFGLPKNLGEAIRPGAQYCCLATVEYEDDRRLPARQKMWSWMVRSLRGNRAAVGAYHYLVDEVQIYDIAALFKRLVEVLEQITICSVDDELENVIKMDFNPSKQNVFSYLGDLRRAIKKLHDLCERLPLNGRITLPDSYVKSRLVRAARQVPVYKPVIDRLLITPTDDWAVLSSEDLFHQLEAVCANEQALYAAPSGGAATDSNAAYEGTRANKAQTNAKKERKDPVCFKFSKGQPCDASKCRFKHIAPEQKSVSGNSKISAPATASLCLKCGGKHLTNECKCTAVCHWCGKTGHLESFCLSKLANLR